MRETSNLEIKQTELNASKEDRILTSVSSKGNQEKWYNGEQWVKADSMGYEGLSECLVSEFAHHTNISNFAPITDYFICHGEVQFEDKTENYKYRGCYSTNFLNKGETCVTLHNLFNSILDKSLYDMVSKMSTKEHMGVVVDIVSKHTKLTNFGEWLICLLEFDSIILNEDRHYNNIAVVKTIVGDYKLMPLFDNGLSLLSDDSERGYPVRIPIVRCIEKVKSKPFSTSFKKQLKAGRELFGPQLEVYLQPEDLNMQVADSVTLYPDYIKNRALQCLRHQLTVWHNDVERKIT
jgi:hypothetical protein